MEQRKRLSIVGALAFGLFGGAAVSMGGSLLQVADANVGAAARTQRWETHVEVGNNSSGDLVGRVNKLGDQGWELSTVVETRDGNLVAFLKRAKQ